jgi:hypothetical protein
MAAEDRWDSVRWITLPNGASNGTMHVSLLATLKPKDNQDDLLVKRVGVWADWLTKMSTVSFRLKLKGSSSPGIDLQPATPIAKLNSKYWDVIFVHEAPPGNENQVSIRTGPPKVLYGNATARLHENVHANYGWNLWRKLGTSRRPLPAGVSPPIQLGLRRNSVASAASASTAGQWAGDVNREIESHLMKVSDRWPESVNDEMASAIVDFHKLEYLDQPINRTDADLWLQFARFWIYHGRQWNERREIRGSDTAARAADTSNDANLPYIQRGFSQQLGIIRNYPPIMEALGVLIRFEINPAPQIAQGDSVSICVFPAGQPTSCLGESLPSVVDSSFYPLPRPESELFQGYFNLSGATDSYVLAQIEVDGAVIRQAHYTDETPLYDQALQASLGNEETFPSPTGGRLALLRTDNASKLKKRLRAINSAASNDLYADDLLGFYEPEVTTENSTWASLTERQEQYAFQNTDLNLPQQIVSFGVRSVPRKVPDPIANQPRGDRRVQPSQPNNDEYQLSDAIFTWDGWHLVVPNPLNPSSTAHETGEPAEDCAPRVADAFKLPFNAFAEIVKKPSTGRGEQIRLRYGRKYAVRLKALNLAGDPMGPKSSSQAWKGEWSSDSTYKPGDIVSVNTYSYVSLQADNRNNPPKKNSDWWQKDPLIAWTRNLRPECLQPPHVLLVDSLDTSVFPGEMLHRLVVRSATGQGGNDSSRRAIVPPRVSVQFAIRHGKFDRKSPFDVGTFSGVPLDRGDFVHDPKSRLPISILPSTSDECRPSDSQLQLGCHDSEPLPAEYLPDPMCRKLLATVTTYPGNTAISVTPGYPIEICTDEEWPEARVVRVLLQTAGHHNSATWWDSLQGFRTLVVALAPGEQAWLSINSVMNESDCEKHLATEAITSYVSPEHLSDACDEIRDGSNSIVTPPRKIFLVHAVEKPPKPPDLTHGSYTRDMGSDTVWVKLTGTAETKFISEIEVTASWNDCITMKSSPSLAVRSVPAHAGVQPNWMLENNGTTDANTLTQDGHHTLPDTGYRRIRYQASGRSRFGEYFVSKGETSEPGVGVMMDVLNCANPSAPTVAYLVPMFAWETGSQQKAGNKTNRVKHCFRSIRRGGLLRVYLSSPPCVSGEGEQIGIVTCAQEQQRGDSDQYPLLPTAGTAQEFDRERREQQELPVPTPVMAPPVMAPMSLPSDYHDIARTYVSRWGGDTLYPSIVATDGPEINDIKSGRLVKRAYIPDLPQKATPREPGFEYPLYPVSLATFDPILDERKNLWYFDVAMKVPSAFCFVRLALVRYQEKSFRFAECSPVTLADFIQLNPDRSVIIVRDGHDKVNVFVCGIENDRTNNQFEITIDRESKLHHDTVWWTRLGKEEFDVGPIPDRSASSQFESTLFSAQVYLKARGGKLRLALWEYECHSSDRRLIYADALQIPDNNIFG